jgi:hypothetical protein
MKYNRNRAETPAREIDMLECIERQIFLLRMKHEYSDATHHKNWLTAGPKS